MCTKVNSVAFGRNEHQINNRFYMSSENAIFAYDLRHTEKPLIVLNDKNIFCNIPNTRDELNEITVSEQGNYLSSADDFGEIHIYSLSDLDNYAQSTAITPSAVFAHTKKENIVTTNFCDLLI